MGRNDLAKISEKKVIAMTMGDPCGIGPEITVKTLADKNIHSKCRPILIGDADILEQAAEKIGIKHFMGKYADYIYHAMVKLQRKQPVRFAISQVVPHTIA